VGVLEVSFTPPADGGSPIVGYEYSLDGGTTWVTPNPAITSSPFTITGLASGIDYAVQIRAVNAAGEGAESGLVVAATSQLGGPSAVTLTPGSGQLEVAFTPPPDGGSPITGYEYSLDGDDNWTAAGTASSPFTITGLTNGQSVSVILRARNSTSEPGVASATVQGIPGPPPSSPGSVTVTAGFGELEVAFTEPDDGGNPIIHFEFSLDDGDNWDSVTQDPPSSPFIIADLDDETTYQVRVRAVNAAGVGQQSDMVIATTPVRPPPAAPTAASIPLTINAATVHQRARAVNPLV
jgi:titin